MVGEVAGGVLDHAHPDGAEVAGAARGGAGLAGLGGHGELRPVGHAEGNIPYLHGVSRERCPKTRGIGRLRPGGGAPIIAPSSSTPTLARCGRGASFVCSSGGRRLPMIPGMALQVVDDEPDLLEEPKIRVGRCFFDARRRRLTDEHGAEVPMTPLEFDLLRAFVQNPNRPLSRDRLLEVSPRGEREPYDRCVDLRVMRLRRKIEPDARQPRFIRTIRSEGYVFL